MSHVEYRLSTLTAKNSVAAIKSATLKKANFLGTPHIEGEGENDVTF